MPEGDTIHRAAANLRAALQGKPVLRFESFVTRISRASEQALNQTTVSTVESRGKNLLIGFSNGWTLHTHMKMTGSWHIYKEKERWRKPQWQARVAIHVPEYVAICFNAPLVELHAADPRNSNEHLRNLGPDILNAEEFHPSTILERMKQMPDLEIGVALLEQGILAGIGNIYKNETLFIEGIDPWKTVNGLDDRTLERIIRRAEKLMSSNLKGDRRTTTRMDPANRFWVYRRAGKPCLKCGSVIEMRRQGSQLRSTYFCGICQK